ncbi:MAG: hypothetical protein AB7G28_03780 [Pirellulales bacterium]
MIDVLREIRTIHADNLKRLQRCKSRQIFAGSLRVRIRSVVDAYFRTDRPVLRGHYRNSGAFSKLDEQMQALLSLTQRNSTRAKYVDLLKGILRELDAIELQLLPVTGDLVGMDASYDDQGIVLMREQCSPSAARCYRQGLQDLSDSSRQSWRGTATEFRETLREVLDSLASDDDVSATPGFKLEPNTHRPTMRQKARYILKQRKSNELETVVSLVDTVDERFGGFVRNVYSQSSATVHSSGLEQEIRSLKKYVDLALNDLLGATTSIAV